MPDEMKLYAVGVSVTGVIRASSEEQAKAAMAEALDEYHVSEIGEHRLSVSAITTWATMPSGHGDDDELPFMSEDDARGAEERTISDMLGPRG